MRESSVAEARLQSVSASSLTVSVHPLEMSASRRPRIRWRESLVCLLWAAVIACQAVGTTIREFPSQPLCMQQACVCESLAEAVLVTSRLCCCWFVEELLTAGAKELHQQRLLE